MKMSTIMVMLFITASGSDIDLMQQRWAHVDAWEVSVCIDLVSPDDTGKRQTVRTDSVRFWRKGEQWKYEWRQPDGRGQTFGHSERLTWSLLSGGDKTIGIVYPTLPELGIPFTNVSDPFSVTFLIDGKPIWIYPRIPSASLKVPETVSPKPAPFGGGGYGGNDGANPLDEVQVVLPDESTPGNLRAYDLLVYTNGRSPIGVVLAKDVRSAFDQLDIYNWLGEYVRDKFTIIERDTDMGLPTYWRHDRFDSEGKWLSGYVAKRESLNLSPTIDAAIFEPDFPPGTYVKDYLLGKSSTDRDRATAGIVGELRKSLDDATVPNRVATDIAEDFGADSVN